MLQTMLLTNINAANGFTLIIITRTNRLTGAGLLKEILLKQTGLFGQILLRQTRLLEQTLLGREVLLEQILLRRIG